jgi:SAM-dependent methyltransferase
MSDSVDDHSRVISHGHDTAASLAATIAATKARISRSGVRPAAEVADLLRLVDELAGFPFGRFLLENRGWNGAWTDYVVTHPDGRRDTGIDSDGRPLTPLERQLLDSFPTVLATQERARHFAEVIQDHVRAGATLASIPCGLMRDLLARDYRRAAAVHLVGIDLDEESLAAACCLAAGYGLAERTAFFREDAWHLAAEEEFDLIASNGLNIYEPDDGRVTELYARFRRALKPGGILVTSFLTPPPGGAEPSPWDLQRVDAEALERQRQVFVDILDARFQCYRSEATTAAQLVAAGFAPPRFIPDAARMFITAVAERT